jgi:ribosomal protein L16 Arg81 hydroxylase
MASIGFVVPVLPGKEQADREWLDEMDGARRDEYLSAWRNAGVTRHTVWQQQTADGTADVVYIEADDIAAAMQDISRSDEPFQRWFRERVLDVHGIDLTSQTPPQSEQIHDTSF